MMKIKIIAHNWQINYKITNLYSFQTSSNNDKARTIFKFQMNKCRKFKNYAAVKGSVL